jgi:hypothetical protein
MSNEYSRGLERPKLVAEVLKQAVLPACSESSGIVLQMSPVAVHF